MKKFKVTVNGTPYDVVVEEVAGLSAPLATAPPVAIETPAATPAVATTPAVAPPTQAPAATTPPTVAAPVSGAEVMDAPMPGTILDIKVKVGDNVRAGQVLVVLEAMKMENEIMAPRDAVIAGVHANKNDVVNSGDALISLN